MLFDRLGHATRPPPPSSAGPPELTPSHIKQQLDRVLSSKAFGQANRLKRFLSFIVEETTSGRGEQLKEHVLGIEVFEKGDDYDPRIDPIVRTEARRLRYKLKEYYDTEGRDDVLIIDLPKGAYSPAFRALQRPEQRPPQHPPTRTRWKNWAFPIAVISLVAAIGALTYWAWQVLHPSTTSLAVLPLENLSSDLQQEYFSEGITDALITDLAKIGTVRVISRTSVLRFKRTKTPVPEIARQLAVDYLVEGTVLRSANRVRITAQLIAARNERHLWAESYERDMDDILALQSEVAQAITSQINVRLTAQQQRLLSTPRSINAEAYDAYLKGRYLWSQRNPEGIEKSIGYFRQAIAREPNFAVAYAALADSYIVLLGMHWKAATEMIPSAKAAATRALELDPALAEPHAVLAEVAESQWNWRVADQEFQHCIQLAPNYATGHQWYSSLLSNWGRFGEAIREAKRALELDPLSPAATSAMGVVRYRARQYGEAVRQFHTARDVFPQQVMTGIPLAMAYLAQRNYTDAIKILEEVAAQSHRIAPTLALLSYAYGASGNKVKARELFAELIQHSRRSPVLMLTAYLALGDREHAIESLQEGYEQHAEIMDEIKVGPMFDDLRSDRRFQDVLRKMNWPD